MYGPKTCCLRPHFSHRHGGSIIYNVFDGLYLLCLIDALEVIFCNYWIIIKTNCLFNIFVTSTEFTKHWILFIVHQINPLSFVMCLSLGDIVKLPSLEAYVSKTIRYTISKWILIGTILDHHEVLLLNNAISVLYPMYFKCKKFIQLQTKKCTHEFITLQ